MQECMFELRNLIDKYGNEDFRKATFIEMLGGEEQMYEPDFIYAIDKLYTYYMEKDYFDSPLDSLLYDKYIEYRDVNTHDEEKEDEEIYA